MAWGSASTEDPESHRSRLSYRVSMGLGCLTSRVTVADTGTAGALLALGAEGRVLTGFVNTVKVLSLMGTCRNF